MLTHILCSLLDETHWIIGNNVLPNKNFPLVFQSVNGECEQEAGGQSRFNKAEVAMIMKWITKLLETQWNGKRVFVDDIGVVSPYKKQCDLIREELINNGYGKISVGSAEVFQGQERRIIIISTVRSGKDLGFVGNEQVNIERVG